MKKFVAILALVVLAMLAVLPMGAMAASQKNELYVFSANGKGVNLRANPSTKADVLAQLGEGKPLTVVEYCSNGWTKVCAEIDGKFITGYAMNQFLDAADPAECPQVFCPVSGLKVKVTPSRGTEGFVNLRAKASEKATIYTRMHMGDALNVLAESHSWYKVKTADGTVGYVIKAFVQKV